MRMAPVCSHLQHLSIEILRDSLDSSDATGSGAAGFGAGPGNGLRPALVVSAYPRDPADTIILTVVVLPVAEASGRATHPAAVRLQTIRTRTAR